MMSVLSVPRCFCGETKFMESPDFRILKRIGTMNQEVTVLSQRDRTYLDWIWIQSGGPRRAATRVLVCCGSWVGGFAKMRAGSGAVNRGRQREETGLGGEAASIGR